MITVNRCHEVEWVTAAYEAKLKGLPAPSLLPVTTAQPIALAA
jgi:hypothetical protein